ncbi:MAG: HAD family hydrolase [Thermodesulfobacteriota bacterium]
MKGMEYQGQRVPCNLVIFDKDGTLIDFTATWVPLIRKRVTCVLKRLGSSERLESLLLKGWGIDPITGKVDPRGPCPVSPRSDEIVIGTMVLYQNGLPWDEAKLLISQAFDEADQEEDWRKQVVPIQGIKSFLVELKRHGFFVALATSDERKDTEAILRYLGFNGLFDVILCSGEVSPPKPHPETILTICRILSVAPRETIMIGDSVTDMWMGKKAGVALTVGVLEGGITPKEELERVADIVVESIRELKFNRWE